MRRWIAAISLSFLVATMSSRASAAENRWQVGGGIGLADLQYKSGNAALGVELDLTYGLTDQFNVLVELSASDHHSNVGSLDHHVSALVADAGIAYTLDVIQIVPYAGALIGGARLAGGDSFGHALSGQQLVDGSLDLVAAVGVDYQFSRSLTLGLAGRFHFLVAAPQHPEYITVLARAAYSWGF